MRLTSAFARLLAAAAVFLLVLIGVSLTPIKANAAASALTQSWSAATTGGTSSVSVAFGNNKVWVANIANNLVQVFNADTGTSVTSVDLNWSPHQISFDNGNLYVAFSNTSSIARISSSYSVTYSAALCSGSTNDHVWAAGGKVFVSCFTLSKIYEVNATTLATIQNVSPGLAPFGIAATSSKVFVDFGATTAIYDPSNLSTALTTISASMPTATAHAWGFDSNYYWQIGANVGVPSKLLRVKLSDSTFTTYTGSTANQAQIKAIASDGNHVFMANNSESKVTSWDITAGTLQDQITGAPTALAVGSAKLFAVVAGVLYGYAITTSQTVTWAPTNTANSLAASPVTPSVSATSSGPGAISYQVVGTGGSGCTVDANTGVVSATALGVCTVRATAAASGIYTAGSVDVQFSFKTSQTITWAPTNTTNLVGYMEPNTDATSDQLGWITYTVVNAGTTGCVVNSTPSVSASSAGVCVVRAAGAATSTAFSGYVDVSFTFTGTQTVTWGAWNTNNFLYASPVTPNLAASSTGPGAISYAIQSAGTTGCTVNSSTGAVSATSVGDCVVRATAAATTYYSSAYIDKTFAFLSNQTVTWTPITTLLATGSEVAISSQATSSGPGAISYSVDNSNRTSGCTVNSTTGAITANSAGTCGVWAYSAATTHYYSASTLVIFAIQKAQTLTWTPANTDLQLLWSPFAGTQAAVSDGSGLITYSVQDAGTTGCSINSSNRTITYTGMGYCVIRATAAASGNWLSGYVDVTFRMVGTQLILWLGSNLTQSSGTLTPSPPTAYSNNGTLTPTGASFIYSVANAGTTGCTVNSATGVVSWIAIGLCQITATAQAIGLYLGGAVSTANFNFYADQTISWAPTNTTNSFSAGAVTPNVQATSSGPGTISYALAIANAACSLNTTTGMISANARTTCYVRASAAASGFYNSANGSLVIFRFAGPQTMSWAATNTTNPSTHSVTPNASPVKQGGAISYSVVAGGTGSCTVDSVTGVITPSTIGTCVIRATSAAFSTYEVGTIDKTFTFVTGQIVTWPLTNATNLTSSGAVTPSALASSNTGAAITYSIQSAGTTGCTVNAATAVVTPLNDGICVVRATAAATANEVSDYTDVTFTFSSPININSVSSSTSPDVYLTAWNSKLVVLGSLPTVSVQGYGFTSNVQITVGGKTVAANSVSANTLTFDLPLLAQGDHSYVISFANSATITVQHGVKVIPAFSAHSVPIAVSAKTVANLSLVRAQSVLAKAVASIDMPMTLVCTARVTQGASAKLRSQVLSNAKAMCSKVAGNIGTKSTLLKWVQVKASSALLGKVSLALEVQSK